MSAITANLSSEPPAAKALLFLQPVFSGLHPTSRDRRCARDKRQIGWSDPGISAAGTVAYFESMTKAVGGQKQADDFARLFMVPGMHHCGGGSGPNAFDMLPVLEAWVEKGVAPEQVVASRITDGKVERTRPLCPHPQVAVYRGAGDINDAASFECKVKS